MTGIKERRFWPQAMLASQASALAGKKAMAAAKVGPADIDLLIHSSVCRDRLEPSTAAYVHGLLGLGPQAQIMDISNACLGFLNGRHGRGLSGVGSDSSCSHLCWRNVSARRAYIRQLKRKSLLTRDSINLFQILRLVRAQRDSLSRWLSFIGCNSITRSSMGNRFFR